MVICLSKWEQNVPNQEIKLTGQYLFIAPHFKCNSMFTKQIKNGLDLTDEAKNITAIYDTSLEPGQGIPLQFHPDLEEICYILSGYGMMIIGDETKEIERYDVIYIQKTSTHTLNNTGNLPLRFITLSVKVKEETENIPYIS
jgi:mannose-6-phosphate isomerase-like protein (cupin superfamily)